MMDNFCFISVAMIDLYLLLLTFSFSIINIYIMILAPAPADPDTRLKYAGATDARAIIIAGLPPSQNGFISNPFSF